MTYKEPIKKIIEREFKLKEPSLEEKCLMCFTPLKTYHEQLRGYCDSCNRLLKE